MNKYFQKMSLLYSFFLLACNHNKGLEVKLTDQDLIIINNQSFYYNFINGDILKIGINIETNKSLWVRIQCLNSATPIINKKITKKIEENLSIMSGGIHEIKLISNDTLPINYSVIISRIASSEKQLNLSQNIVAKYDTTHQMVEKIKFEISPKQKKNVSFSLLQNTDYWVYSINTINETADEKVVLNNFWDQLIRYGLKKLDRIPEFNSTQKVDCFFSSQKEASDFANGAKKLPQKWPGFKSGYSIQELNDLVSIKNTPSKKVGIGLENKSEYQLINVVINAVSFNVDTTLFIE